MVMPQPTALSVLGRERPCLRLVGPSGGHLLPLHPVRMGSSRYQR
jgi:hypothetical protein